jgi:hypothetical protein
MGERAIQDSTRVLSLQKVEADSTKVDSTKQKSAVSVWCSAISVACEKLKGKINWKSSLSVQCPWAK